MKNGKNKQESINIKNCRNDGRSQRLTGGDFCGIIERIEEKGMEM